MGGAGGAGASLRPGDAIGLLPCRVTVVARHPLAEDAVGDGVRVESREIAVRLDGQRGVPQCLAGGGHRATGDDRLHLGTKALLAATLQLAVLLDADAVAV